jgi:hypothetical protein
MKEKAFRERIYAHPVQPNINKRYQKPRNKTNEHGNNTNEI